MHTQKLAKLSSNYLNIRQLTILNEPNKGDFGKTKILFSIENSNKYLIVPSKGRVYLTDPGYLWTNQWHHYTEIHHW